MVTTTGRQVPLPGTTGIFRRKPIATDRSQLAESHLEGTLGLWQLTAIGLGAIIGAGIFALAGPVAATTSGPAVTVSFLVAGFASACAALSYAEFGGLIPQAGSAYTYGYSVLGEFPGWMIGWDLLLEYTAIVAVVAIGISGYVNFLLTDIGLGLPAWLASAPGGGDGGVVNISAVVLCLLVAWLLNRGIRSSAQTETVLVFVKIAIVLAVIVVGAFYVKTGNLTPYFPHGIGGTITGAATVFFAVFGYDAMSTAAEESKDAQRTLPKAIILSLSIAMVLYLLAATILTGMRHYSLLNSNSAFADAFAAVGLQRFADVIAIGAIVGIVTVLFSFTLGASRVWYAIARDGLLPQWFTRTNAAGSPYRPTWIVGIIAAAIAGVVPIGDAAKLTNIGILLAFVVVSAAVIVLRYTQPDLPRTFRTPLMPVTPVLGIGFSVWLIYQLDWATWVRFAVWFVIGCMVYGFYGRHHARLAHGEVVHTDDAHA